MFFWIVFLGLAVRGFGSLDAESVADLEMKFLVDLAQMRKCICHRNVFALHDLYNRKNENWISLKDLDEIGVSVDDFLRIPTRQSLERLGNKFPGAFGALNKRALRLYRQLVVSSRRLSSVTRELCSTTDEYIENLRIGVERKTISLQIESVSRRIEVVKNVMSKTCTVDFEVPRMSVDDEARKSGEWILQFLEALEDRDLVPYEQADLIRQLDLLVHARVSWIFLRVCEKAMDVDSNLKVHLHALKAKLSGMHDYRLDTHERYLRHQEWSGRIMDTIRAAEPYVVYTPEWLRKLDRQEHDCGLDYDADTE